MTHWQHGDIFENGKIVSHSNTSANKRSVYRPSATRMSKKEERAFFGHGFGPLK